MSLLVPFVSFAKVFMLVMSILYILKVVYGIAKVYTLKEGVVDMGKYGLLLLACSISYIITIIFV